MSWEQGAYPELVILRSPDLIGTTKDLSSFAPYPDTNYLCFQQHSRFKRLSAFVFYHIPASSPPFPHRSFVFNNIPASFRHFLKLLRSSWRAVENDIVSVWKEGRGKSSVGSLRSWQSCLASFSRLLYEASLVKSFFAGGGWRVAQTRRGGSAIIEPSGESSHHASMTGRRTDGKRGAVPSGNRRHAEKMHAWAARGRRQSIATGPLPQGGTGVVLCRSHTTVARGLSDSRCNSHSTTVP